MAQDKTLVGLDIGTSWTRCVIGSATRDGQLMIESIAEENPFRAVHFLYSTQNSESCPLLDEVLAALGGMPNSAKAIFFTPCSAAKATAFFQ